MLLMALSSSALMQYHRMLTHGFNQQWQQREAWRMAEQRLIGHDVAGWQSGLQRRTGPGNCTLESAEVVGPYQRTATLSRLRC
ncbi:prepilin-type cleavage/methylation domain-containing protein [Pantoea sp. LMR881]|nr:prepilin-type N-terminal cleavage/methylation domain-containing protein [Pantoea sp. LMR881]MCZ4060320.1 prepilin-type cleavage/methylation domain-containing protein [Pantoea sp. LMR881]